MVFMPSQDESKFGNFARERLVFAQRLMRQSDGDVHRRASILWIVKLIDNFSNDRNDILKHHPSRFHRAR